MPFNPFNPANLRMVFWFPWASFGLGSHIYGGEVVLGFVLILQRITPSCVSAQTPGGVVKVGSLFTMEVVLYLVSCYTL